MHANASATDQQLEIPEGALSACPIKGFAYVGIAKACVICPHFAGLEDRFPGHDDYAFSARYLLLCSSKPVKRPIIQMAPEGEGA